MKSGDLKIIFARSFYARDRPRDDVFYFIFKGKLILKLATCKIENSDRLCLANFTGKLP
jgi:hypothetical protein